MTLKETSLPRRYRAVGRRLALGLLLVLGLGAVGCATNPYPPIRLYHSNNRLAEETRFDSDGRKHGKCRTWYDWGLLRSVKVYEHGKLVSIEMWGPDSQKIRLPKLVD